MEYPQNDVIIGGKWLVLSKIGEGSFGEVFKAQDINTESFYAIKREPLLVEHPQLEHEYEMYSALAGGFCVPKCHWYGQYDGFNCIVMDLLGSSLKEFQQTVREIPLETVIDIGDQLISCLEYVHKRGLVYRDIKPENFLFSSSFPITNQTKYFSSCRDTQNGWDKQTSISVVDFGLATWWRNPKTMKPFPDCKKPQKFKIGTARYASLNVHHGRTHARRDDLESLGYLLLDLLLAGELPWSGVTARTSKTGWDRIKIIKEETMLQDLCLGLPKGIMDFIDYTRRLRFGDRPDYDHLRRILRGCNQVGPFSRLVTPHLYTKLIPSPPRYQQQNYNNKQFGNTKKNESYVINATYCSSPKRKGTASDNGQRYSYYPQPQTQQQQQQQQQQQPQQQQEDVFIMDDLIKELPSFMNSQKKPDNNHYHGNASRPSNAFNNRKHYQQKHYGSNNRFDSNDWSNYSASAETNQC